MVSNLQNEIVQLKAELWSNDITRIEKPIEESIEDKKQLHNLNNNKQKIFSHFKNEYNLVSKLLNLETQYENLEFSAIKKKVQNFKNRSE